MNSIFSRVLEILSDQAVATILGTVATIVGLVGSAYGLYRWIKERRKAELARQHQATAWRAEFDRSVDAGQFEAAYSIASAIADPASGHSDRSARRAVHLKTIEGLDVEFAAADDNKRRQIVDSIRGHIEALRKLHEPRHLLFALQARLAHLEGKPKLAIEFGKKSLKSTGALVDQGDPLVTILEASRQCGDFEGALAFEDQVHQLLAAENDPNNQLILNAAWLKILAGAQRISQADIEKFVASVRNARASQKLRAKQILRVIDDLAQNLNQMKDTDGCVAVLRVAFDLSRDEDRTLMAANIALQLSELFAFSGEQAVAEQYSVLAMEEIEKLRNAEDAAVRRQWASSHANALAARGRLYMRLASHAEKSGESSAPFLERAKSELELAEQFSKNKEADIHGDIAGFRLDLSLWLAEALSKLGLLSAAAECLRRNRPDLVPSMSERFGSKLVESTVCEAESVLFGGDANRAMTILDSISFRKDDGNAHIRQATALREYIAERVLPVSNWLESAEAQLISNGVARDGLRPILAAHTAPLAEWWREFHSESTDAGAHSEILDVWGRGGFARVVAAIRASPLSAIAVDATTTNQIAQWARLFCPLYDVVVIKWKGKIDGGLAIIPLPPDVGITARVGGGQGYVKSSTRSERHPGWMVATGWGNFVPQEVAQFLASEALSLIEAGRLVFLPAPMVGCTQAAVGWTDNMLMDDLLGGVVNVVGKSRLVDESGLVSRRSHDLSQISVPFIDGVPLRELNSVLDDTAEWIGPMRKLLRGSLGSSELRRENWQSLSPILDDLREATRELNDRLSTMANGKSDWRVSEAISAIAAGATGAICPGVEPCTSLLRAVTAARPDLAPWVPYWRLQDAGGEINWAGALSNRSREPSEEERRQLAARGADTPVSQSWLYPGAGTPGISSIRRI